MPKLYKKLNNVDYAFECFCDMCGKKASNWNTRGRDIEWFSGDDGLDCTITTVSMEGAQGDLEFILCPICFEKILGQVFDKR